MFLRAPPIPVECCQGCCYAESIEGLRERGDSNIITGLKVNLIQTNEGMHILNSHVTITLSIDSLLLLLIDSCYY